jgi:hypothetical protein
MTLLGVPRKHRACRIAALANQPADCSCDVCQRPVAADEPRHRCAGTACDDVHVCDACAAQPPLRCPGCGTEALVYRDRASAFLLRSQVFAEAFADRAAAGPADIVHPRTMVLRALRSYAGRPLLGELFYPPAPHQRPPPPSVRWFSYAQCGAAARALARRLLQLPGPGGGGWAVAVCAVNSVGWLIADWACALGGTPSIAADASLPPAAWGSERAAHTVP